MTLLLFRHARPRARAASHRGQSLVEFAIAFPVLMLLIGAIVQFGIIFWGQNTLTQIARDSGRWASTQPDSPCSSIAATTFANQADQIARASGLVGYTAGEWSSANYVSHAENTSLPATPPNTKGIETLWTGGPGTCPPASNSATWFFTIRVSHVVPIFFPWIPGNGNLTTIAQFRMEPHP